MSGFLWVVAVTYNITQAKFIEQQVNSLTSVILYKPMYIFELSLTVILVIRAGKNKSEKPTWRASLIFSKTSIENLSPEERQKLRLH